MCFVIDTWFPIVGGGPQVVLNYSKFLTSRYNCRIFIITRRFSNRDKNYTVNKNISVIRLGLVSSWNNPIGRLSFMISVFFHLINKRYDLIHAFPFISGLPSRIAGYLLKTPVVFSIFALSSQDKTNHKISNKIRILIEHFLTFTLPYDLLITDNLENIKKHNRDKIIYIPNGVDIDLFDSVTIEKEKIMTILFVGRFHPQKGIQTLLKSIKQIRKKISRIHFTLVGYGPLENHIKEYINKYNLDKFIFIKKPLYSKELVKEYKRSHLLVLPSLYEGQGIVVFEAWAAKIPVITTKVGLLKHVVKDGYNGYLIQQNRLSQSIFKMIKDKNRAQMGKNGYNTVKKEYTWEISVNKLYQEYNKLLNYENK